VSLLLRNGRVDGVVGDLLIDGGRIAAIGADLVGDEVVDLDGRHVLPGLWDEHVHLSQHAMARRRVDLSGAGSAAEAARIMGVAERQADGTPLVGYGFRDALWADAPDVALLDASVAEPAVLVGGDLHCVWLNSAALERFGHAGHPTGLLREDAAYSVSAALRDVPDEVLDAWVAEAAASAAERGVVGVVDLEMADNFAVWGRRMAAGFGSLRIDAGVYTDRLDAAIAAGHRSGESLGRLLTVGPFKVLIDGSLNTRTAYCVDEYPGVHSHGQLTVQPDDLLALLRKATAAGFVPAVHAIGDEANRLALDAFEALGVGGRIEHAQLLREADYARFAELDVAASVQPEHAMDDREVADRYWAGRTGRSFVLRSLLDAGATLLLGSDAPVAPLDPWVTIAAAVTRSRDGREPWHPEQGITVAEAISASTRTTVAVGQPADLVMVEVHPADAPGDELRRMPVAGTLLSGNWTYSSL
jgi:predicted amidohydrolase YtcJ